MNKLYSALVKNQEGTATTIKGKEFPNKKAFITDLRAHGYKVDSDRVKPADLFDYIINNTAATADDWKLRSIPEDVKAKESGALDIAENLADVDTSAGVCISKSNQKMGAVPSVSLPPIVTCPAGCPCAKKCYAAKIARLRKNVRLSYWRNLKIWTENPELYFASVKVAAAMQRFFRWHVSGDIVNADYFRGMVDVAGDLPGTKFLVFTKKYKIVNDWLDNNGGKLPENMQVIFSAWGKEISIPNPYNLPVAQVVFKGEDPEENWFVCGGNCAHCACRGMGCWALKHGETVAFNEH